MQNHYDSATRSFSITQTGGVKYWFEGVEIIANETLTIQHSTFVNNYFIYFQDNSGVLSVSTSPWDLLIHVPVCLIYYDGTKGIAWEERHGSDRDRNNHRYLHETHGTQYISGLTISDYTLESSLANSTKFSVASGLIADEDILPLLCGQTDDKILSYELGVDINLVNLKISEMVKLGLLNLNECCIERPRGDFLKNYQPDKDIWSEC